MWTSWQTDGHTEKVKKSLMPLFNKLLLGNYAEFHEIKKKTYFHIMLNNCIEFPSSLKHTVGEWIFSIKFVYIVLSWYYQNTISLERLSENNKTVHTEMPCMPNWPLILMLKVLKMKVLLNASHKRNII